MIRPCISADEKSLLALWNGFDNYHCSLSDYYFQRPTADEQINRHQKYMDNKHSLYLLCEIEGEIIGFICGIWRKTPSACLVRERLILELHAIYIESENRNSGYGKLLIQEAVKKAKRRKVNDVEVHIWNFNSPVIDVIKELQFHQISGKYGLTIHEKS